MGYKIAINKMKLAGKLPEGDRRWPEFNDSFENLELDIEDIANAIYCGQAYCPHVNGRRNTDNFVCAQYIAVDLETHDERSSMKYLANMELVKVYGGLIYNTPSHTEADPRSRVLFFLDQPLTTAPAYKSAIEFIYTLFPGSDTNCIKASGFFYGSKDCKFEWIDNVFPLAHLRRYYARYHKEVKPVSPPQPVRSAPAVSVPLPQDEAQKVQDALRRIDPMRISYQEWVNVLMALHRELGDSGLSLAEQWAQGKPGEVGKKWKSFKNSGNGSGAVTLGTVYHMAKM